MSEHLKTKATNNLPQTQVQAEPQVGSKDQVNGHQMPEEDTESENEQNPSNYIEAKKLCEAKMQELQLQIQDLSPEEQKEYLEQAQAQCNEYLVKFMSQEGDQNEVSQEMPSEQMTQEQQMILYQQHLQALSTGQLQGQFQSQSGKQEQLEPGLTEENPELQAFQEQALQQQQLGMFLQQMGQNFNQEEFLAQIQDQYKNTMRQQMGNQLRQFAQQMFKRVNQRQKNKLHTKAKQFLDSYIKDQRKLQQSLGSASTNLSHLGSVANGYLESPEGFEFQADPQKYLDEIENSLKKHKDLAQNFQRFIQKVFDDTEQEQVYTDFITTYHEVYAIYHELAMSYNFAQHCEDEEKQEMLGTQIFNLIMPYAQKMDPKLLNLIPKETLEKFKIEYESDHIHIKTWLEIDNSGSNSSNSDGNSGDDSQVSQDGTSNDQNISSNSQAIGDSSDQENDTNEDEDASMIDNDMSQTDLKRRGKGRDIGYPPNMLPQSALTGKNKSLMVQINYFYPSLKNVNKNDIKHLDNFFKSLKDDRDWNAFCKILYLYFEGVFSLTEFCKIYEDKFSLKLKQDVKEDIEKLLPTRDQNRRALSTLLKPWNDTENQTFQKIPDSSYYKIESDFPIPTCTRKMMEEIYWKNINDQYLSLATGSENFKFKFRNTNEENIYKTEDKMYELDTQIDNIQKSLQIVTDQCDYFETLSEEEQAKYKFPCMRLNPLRFYWDQKFKKSIFEQYLKEGKQLKTKEMASMKQTFVSKLEFLKNQKTSNLNEFKDQFRKNFTKSLDHKSFQYKDFMKKYLQKQNIINRIKQISEDNNTKKRLFGNDLLLLYGSGEQSVNSDYKFFNTYGKDFAGKFDQRRLVHLQNQPDHPIDMKFFESVDQDTRLKVQSKCPHARFLMNDRQAVEISLKLLLQFIKQQNSASMQPGDKKELIEALKFIMESFLQVNNFDEIEKESDKIQPLTCELIEILLNSADYYQRKYTGEIKHMEEVFPIEDPSLTQSPLKQKQSSPIQQSEQQLKQSEGVDSEKSKQSSESKASEKKPELRDCEMMTIDSSQEGDENDRIQKDLFIPRFVKDTSKPIKERYQLLYGPLNIYMFLVFFYSVYERILKAKEFVKQKVKQDFEDDFSQREWSVKFKSRTQTLIDERFSYLIKAILTVMIQSNVLDINKYEDVARELLGNEAYLLFQVDKIVNHCQKQLNLFVTDSSCKVSKQLFEEFKTNNEESESVYLSSFYELANEQSIQNQLILVSKNNNPATQQTGAAAVNKDLINPNMNLQSFRFMYSPKSGILTIHYLVLHPFYMQEQKKVAGIVQPILKAHLLSTSGDVHLDEKVKGLRDLVCEPISVQEDPLPEGIEETSPQIYLNRNLNRMKEMRLNYKVTKNNGLQLSVVPLMRQIVYQKQTEDILEVTREPVKNTSLLGKRKFSQIKQDMQFQNEAKNILLKRLKVVNEETNDSELNVHLEQQEQLHNMECDKNLESPLTPNNPEVQIEDNKATPTRKVTRSSQQQQISNQKSLKASGSKKPSPVKQEEPSKEKEGTKTRQQGKTV